MKLSVIALDYDRTLAHGDRLDPLVRDAIADARTQGISVLLVTGRILTELRRVAGELHFVDGVIAENESNPAELEALRRCCEKCTHVDVNRWSMLRHLKIGQAVALPLTEEAGGDLKLFNIAPRLTPHVRHREKYVDVPVSAQRAFVFNTNGQPALRVRTLREFVSELEGAPRTLLHGYLVRGDFSRWIGDVFNDRALADKLRILEERYRAGSREETLAEIVSAVRGRYDLTENEAVPAAR